MNKPNITLAGFCANLGYLDIEDKVELTLYLPDDRTGFDQEKGKFLSIKANSRNLAIYGQWYVTCIDFGGTEANPKFDITIEENPPF